MATQVQTKSGTWQGSINLDGTATYSVGYTVRTDDLEMGADLILGLDELPAIGDRYDLLDDEVNYAFVTSKSARQKSPGFWEVTVKVSNDLGSGKDKGKGQTADDEPTEDWRQIGATIDVSSFRVSRAAELGAYIGKLNVQRNQTPPELSFQELGQAFWDVNTREPKGVHLTKTVALHRLSERSFAHLNHKLAR
jgi:hypothetical protein